MSCGGSGKVMGSGSFDQIYPCPGCDECPCPDCGGLGSTHPIVKSPEGGYHLDITKSKPCPTCKGRKEEDYE